jgi:diacylglycerol kinase
MSFGYALRGIGCLLRTQANARIHLAATIVVVAGGFLLGVSRPEWCALIAAIGLVWTAEGLNTAIEAVVDLASPERDPLAERAKDTAAGAVLLAALAASAIGAIVFIPHIAEWMRR